MSLPLRMSRPQPRTKGSYVFGASTALRQPLQHILAPRRQRMSRMMLAAYMFVKRASKYVAAPGDGAAVTRGPTDAFMAHARAAARALEIQTNRATAPAAATTTPIVVAVDTADSDSESEPNLQAVTHTTRTGRTVRVPRS